MRSLRFFEKRLDIIEKEIVCIQKSELEDLPDTSPSLANNIVSEDRFRRCRKVHNQFLENKVFDDSEFVE